MVSLSPFKLGSLELKNRLVVAPMTTYASQSDGNISRDELPYLERRAAGGFGMVMTAACYVHPSGHAFRGQWSCADESKIESLRLAAESIHRGGSTAVLQIHHGGRQCPSDLVGTPWSASAVPAERPNAVTPKEMTEREILEIIDSYAAAALRAKRAGYDGVEIHGANTYLIQQFVSPHSNRREDRWNVEDLLFPRMVVEKVLDAVGADYPVGYRFSPEETETPGIRLSQTARLIELLCGFPLAFLHVSLRHFAQASVHDDSSGPLTSWIANKINQRLPLISVGGVKSGQDADEALALGASLVAVGRVAISEPEFVSKLQAGEPVRTKLPKGDFAESLTVARGLTDKILSVPDWFEVED